MPGISRLLLNCRLAWPRLTRRTTRRPRKNLTEADLSASTDSLNILVQDRDACLVPAQLGHHQPYLLKGNLRWQDIFERLEAFDTDPAASSFDDCPPVLVYPRGLKLQFSLFDQVGNHTDDTAQLATAHSCDFIEGVSLSEQSHRFLRGLGLLRRDSAGAVPVTKPLQRFKNLLAIRGSLALAEAGDLQQFSGGSRTHSAHFVERSVVHNNECCNSLLFGRRSPPLTKILAQFGVHVFGRRFSFGPGPACPHASNLVRNTE